MAKRRKFSRWRRLPGVYRFGDEKAPDPNLDPQRLSLYISGVLLDQAIDQSDRLGFENVQEYCAELLVKAIDAERFRDQVAGVEAKRGTLEGLHEIADDPEYLAELSAAATPREHAPQSRGPSLEPPAPAPVVSIRLDDYPARRPAERLTGRESLTLSPAALVVLRHAGQEGDDDPDTFLACLRRGETVSPNEVAELAQALHELEADYQGAAEMDRRLTFALHRLAFESQVLHTDAWPGTFDPWTVDVLRAVQETVERILSGQDIRYYPETGPETSR